MMPPLTYDALFEAARSRGCHVEILVDMGVKLDEHGRPGRPAIELRVTDHATRAVVVSEPLMGLHDRGRVAGILAKRLAADPV